MHFLRHIPSAAVFPDAMKLGCVAVIHKGGSVKDNNNHRAISLLPIFAKIVENIIHKRLSGFLRINNVIVSEQFGFRKKQIIEKCTFGNKRAHTRHYLNKIVVLGIFLDFSKAFDGVQDDVLLRKLSCYGIRKKAWSLIKSYLNSKLNSHL